MTYSELVAWKARLMNTLNVDGRIIPGDWSEFISEAVKAGCMAMATDMERRLKSYVGKDWWDK